MTLEQVGKELLIDNSSMFTRTAWKPSKWVIGTDPKNRSKLIKYLSWSPEVNIPWKPNVDDLCATDYERVI